MKVLLALSLFLNLALAGWIAVDMSKKVAAAPVVHSDDYRAVSDKLGRSLALQETGLRKQVALRDSLAHGDSAWLDSQERRDMLARAKELGNEAQMALVEAGTIPDSDLSHYGD